MKVPETRRKLLELGWVFVRRTGRSHEVWQRPNGDTHAFEMTREPKRNEASLLRQAAREAKQDVTKTIMRSISQLSSTSVKAPELEEELMEPSLPTNSAADNHILPATVSKREPKLEVAKWAYNNVVVYFSEEDAKHLGGDQSQVSIVADNGVWLIIPDAKGPGGIRLDTTVSKKQKPRYVLRTKLLNEQIPQTSRTELPAEYREKGFAIFPDLVQAVKYAPPPVATKQPVVAPEPVLLKSQPPAPLVSPAPLVQAAQVTTLEDLKTALVMVREAARTLGAELYFDQENVLRARIVI